MRRALVVLLAIVGLALAEPSWKCKVCEDVVQTWHDRFKCAGQSLSLIDQLENPFGQRASKETIPQCKQPLLDCNDLQDDLKDSCFEQYKEYTEEKGHVIWMGMMDHGSVFKTCVELGKCANPDDDSSSKECEEAFGDPSCKDRVTCAPVQTKCTKGCFLCVQLVRDWPLFQEICKPPLAVLDNLARPVDEKLLMQNMSAPPVPLFLLETQTTLSHSLTTAQKQRHVQRMRTYHRLLRKGRLSTPRTPQERKRIEQRVLQMIAEREREEAEEDGRLQRNSRGPNSPQPNMIEQHARAGVNAGAGVDLYGMLDRDSPDETTSDAPPPDAALAKPEDDMPDGSHAQIPMADEGTLLKTCIQFWDEVRYSKKARYFVQWKEEVHEQLNARDRLGGALWDANVVCKCLGKCALGRFEDFGLMEACKYSEEQQLEMDMALGDQIKQNAPNRKAEDKEEEGGGDGF